MQPLSATAARMAVAEMACLRASLAEGDEKDGDKFRDYLTTTNPLARCLRTRAGGVPRPGAEVPMTKLVQPAPEIAFVRPARADQCSRAWVASQVQWSHQARAADDWLKRVVSWTWKVKLAPALERDLFARLREGAEEVAIKGVRRQRA